MNAGIGDNWLKREGVGQFADSRGWVIGGGLGKKYGGGDAPRHTMFYVLVI